jgi:hypothetical protein
LDASIPRKVTKIVLVAAPIQNSLLLGRLMINLINLINQAREVFCQGRFPDSRASLIYVLAAESGDGMVLIVSHGPVDFYAACLS